MWRRLKDIWARLHSSFRRDVDDLAKWVEREVPTFIEYAAWLVRQVRHWVGQFWGAVVHRSGATRKEFKRFAENIASSRKAQLNLAINLGFWSIVLLWLGIGVGVPLAVARKGIESVADFGDMFGSVNALFSGFGLFLIALTLFTQMRDMRSNERSQKDQLRIAQTTARIQALTVLADLHAKQMESAPQHFGTMFKHNAAYCANRALDLVRELGETFPDAPEKGIKVSFFSRWDYAAMRLQQIYDTYFYGYRLFMSRQERDNVCCCGSWQQISAMLKEWFAVYGQEQEPNAGGIRRVMNDAAELSTMHLTNSSIEGSPPAADADAQAKWDNFWKRCVDLDRTFTFAFKVFMVATREHNQAAEDFDR